MSSTISPTRHAFFDLDKTLTHNFTMHQFCQLLYQNQLISNQFETTEKNLAQDYQAGRLSYRQAGETANQIMATAIKGLSPTELNGYLNQFVHLPRLFKAWTKPVIKFLKHHQFHTHLISGSAQPIAAAIANHLGFNSYAASIPEIKNGRYTGKVVSVMDFEHKHIAMHNILAPHSNTSFTLAFGDSNGDIDMLSQTDLAFVIDPSHPTIIQTAKQNSWHITSEPTKIIQLITQYL